MEHPATARLAPFPCPKTKPPPSVASRRRPGADRWIKAKLSNGPWSAKRAALLQHNTITLTGRVVSKTEHHDWDESLIDNRAAELIDAILDIWPVPEGHLGKVVDPQTKAGDWVELKHLIEAGLLGSGDILSATHRDFKGKEAVLTSDGAIELDGKRYTSPSAAGHALRKKATNGWYFWALGDGRRLRDVRAEFQNINRQTDGALLFAIKPSTPYR